MGTEGYLDTGYFVDTCYSGSYMEGTELVSALGTSEIINIILFMQYIPWFQNKYKIRL